MCIHTTSRKLTRAGKSSLTVQFVDGHFVESYYPTIENTFSKVIKYRGQDFATEIVDTAGQVSARSGQACPCPKTACCSYRSPDVPCAMCPVGRIQHPEFETLHRHTRLLIGLLSGFEAILRYDTDSEGQDTQPSSAYHSLPILRYRAQS